MHRGARIGAMNAPLSQMNLKKTKTAGYVRGSIGKALTVDERKNGGVGFAADEWKGLSTRSSHPNGKMTRGLAGTPLRRNHAAIAGECCDTTVDGDSLNIHAMVDLTTAEGQQAWQDIEEGRLTMFSVGFVARAPADWNEGNRQYENEFREVSLTEKGVVESAYINVAFSKLSENSGQTEEFELKDIATGTSIFTAAVSPSTASPIEEDLPQATPQMSAISNPTEATPMETAPPASTPSPATQAQAPPVAELTPEQIAAFGGMEAGAIANLAVDKARAQAETAELKAQWELAQPFLQRAQQKEEARATRKLQVEEKARSDKMQSLSQLAKDTQFGANLDDPADREIIEMLMKSGDSGNRVLGWVERLATTARGQSQEISAKDVRLSVYEPKGKPATRRAVEALAPASAAAAPSASNNSFLDSLKGLNKQAKPSVPPVAVATAESPARQDLPFNPFQASEMAIRAQAQQYRAQMETQEAMNRAPTILDSERLALELLNSDKPKTGADKCNAAYGARNFSEQFPRTVQCSDIGGMKPDEVYHHAVADSQEDTLFRKVRTMGELGSNFDSAFFYDAEKAAMAALASASNPLASASVHYEQITGYNPQRDRRPAEIIFYPREQISEPEEHRW